MTYIYSTAVMSHTVDKVKLFNIDLLSKQIQHLNMENSLM
jgi:hypothetical protein